LGTLAVGAEQTLRASVAWMMAEDMDTVGDQGRGDHFAGDTVQLVTVPGKGHLGLFGAVENRMGGQAMFGHAVDPFAGSCLVRLPDAGRKLACVRGRG